MDVRLAFSVFDRPSPTLLGLDTQRDLGMVLDTVKGVAYSYRLQKEIPSRLLPSGHLALDLRPAVE